MALLVAVFISGLLFAGFIALTYTEARSGRRLFAPLRASLDRGVTKVGGIVRRAEVGSLAFHGLRAVVEYVVRIFVYAVLSAVRFVERMLTRSARSLRTRDEMLMSSRTFVQAWFSRAKRRILPGRVQRENAGE